MTDTRGPGTPVRVAVLDDYQGRAHSYADWASLGAGFEVVFFDHAIGRDELVGTLAGFEVLAVMRERTAFPREVLEGLPALRLLVTTGMRNASVDVEYLRSERGIVVSGTDISGHRVAGGVPSTVEVAWALILATTKRMLIEDSAIRSGRWQLDIPTNLAGATLGLAGLGNLGSAMVGPARAFGMEVVAWSENLTDERAQSVGVRRVSKDELLKVSDILSIHLVLSRRTRSLFGASELAAMKTTAVLVNTSRGPIVDEAALVDALARGVIAAAGLDVYDHEPLPGGHPLTKLDNVVLSPHLGYANEQAFRHMYTQVVEDIAAFYAASPIRQLA